MGEQRLSLETGPGRPVLVNSGICWNIDQLAATIESLDIQGGLIKFEITHNFTPGKRAYHWIATRFPPIEGGAS